MLEDITSTWLIWRIHDGGYNKYVLEKLTSMWWMWRIHEGGYDKYVLVEITSMWWIWRYMTVVITNACWLRYQIRGGYGEYNDGSDK